MTNVENSETYVHMSLRDRQTKMFVFIHAEMNGEISKKIPISRKSLLFS